VSFAATGRFPRAHRIRKRSEFLLIQSAGRPVKTEHFVLLLYASERAGPGERVGARLGITVTRRLGSAVARNRAKRLIREAFRHTRDLWHDDVDLVVVVRRTSGAMKLADVINEWTLARTAILDRTREAQYDSRKRRAALAGKL
jgi:ribonuclease P protein component